jgi:hypothetical protein
MQYMSKIPTKDVPRNGTTYSGVSGYAHWRIFANLELQLINGLQSEIFIDMIKPLHNKTNVRDSDVLQREITHQFIFDTSLGGATSTAKDKVPRREKCGRVDGESGSCMCSMTSTHSSRLNAVCDAYAREFRRKQSTCAATHVAKHPRR